MSFRFGLTGTFGHKVANVIWGVGAAALSAGVIRAGVVEALQESGDLPEDGRGFIANIPVQSWNNITDAVRLITNNNDITSSADEIYFEQSPDGDIKLVDAQDDLYVLPEGSQIIAIDKKTFDEAVVRQAVHTVRPDEWHNDGMA